MDIIVKFLMGFCIGFTITGLIIAGYTIYKIMR